MTGEERHAHIRELARKPCGCTGQCGATHNSGRGGPCGRGGSSSSLNVAAPATAADLIGPVIPGTVLITWCLDCHKEAVKLARVARDAELKAVLAEAQGTLFPFS